jgi:hypothetical protein
MTDNTLPPRKILYTCDYGSGWTSWAFNATAAEKRFMLEYRPFIHYLEDGGKLSETHRLAEAFKKDWARISMKEPPYLTGLPNLDIKLVPAGALVRIKEHHGLEEVIISNEEWL